MKNLLIDCKNFIKNEMVLSISATVMLISMFFVPPTSAYLNYFDWRVLALLFCLMAVVEGLRSTGIFQWFSTKILNFVHSLRALATGLILLCFFSAMFITNDVALITFIPFSIMMLQQSHSEKHLIKLIVLETIAANLGSIFTPVGNPQNLFLHSYFSVPNSEFFAITAPLTILSLVLLVVAAFIFDTSTFIAETSNIRAVEPKKTALYIGLFILCLLTVFHFIDYRLALLIVTLIIIYNDFRLLKQVDYALLLTFACFFVFVGNLGQIPAINHWLTQMLNKRELLFSVAASQIISNVPAAVLLSGFTVDYRSLILGTNIGGLGTLVASLASLISYKIYVRTDSSQQLKYLLVFTGWNLAFLAALLLAVPFIY